MPHILVLIFMTSLALVDHVDSIRFDSKAACEDGLKYVTKYIAGNQIVKASCLPAATPGAPN